MERPNGRPQPKSDVFKTGVAHDRTVEMREFECEYDPLESTVNMLADEFLLTEVGVRLAERLKPSASDWGGFFGELLGFMEGLAEWEPEVYWTEARLLDDEEVRALNESLHAGPDEVSLPARSAFWLWAATSDAVPDLWHKHPLMNEKSIREAAAALERQNPRLAELIIGVLDAQLEAPKEA